MSPAPASATRGLEDAFRTFNELSVQLAGAYQALEERVAHLNRELAAARDERLAQLAEKERLAARLHSLLQALPAGVVVLDAQGRVQEANAAAHALLGEGLAGMPWRAVIARAFAPRPDDGEDVSLADRRRVNITTCPLGVEPGQILMLMDVTETRRLHAGLEQHRRLAAMGEMAASLAHQVRTPLAAALLNCAHLKRADLPAESRTQYAHKVMDGLRHLEHLVGDMLSFARGGVAVTEAVDAGAVLGRLERALGPSYAELHIALEAPAARVLGDPELLATALQNLATNALAAGGPVELRIAAQGTQLVFAVRDHGPGVAAELSDKIFQPFFTTRAGGTGLGLAVVRAIAEAHGGEVRLEAPADGGARFALALPLAQEAA